MQKLTYADVMAIKQINALDEAITAARVQAKRTRTALQRVGDTWILTAKPQQQGNAG